MKQQTFKTPKGTELPLLDLRGKPYLQVAHRLVWFREDHPTWGIVTEPHSIETNQATFIAQVRDETGRLIATGTKQETRTGFPDFIEKAETGAIGRALALCGYGTQFAPDLDEGERLADAPVAPAKPAPKAAPIKKDIKTRQFEALGQASAEQLKRIAELAVQKLAAKAGDSANILETINAEFKMNLVAGTDLSRTKAGVIISALEAKPDFSLPDFN